MIWYKRTYFSIDPLDVEIIAHVQKDDPVIEEPIEKIDHLVLNHILQ